MTNKHQQLFSSEKKRELNRKTVKELVELENLCQKRMIKKEELVGRQSGKQCQYLKTNYDLNDKKGSTKWRSMRGEMGADLNAGNKRNIEALLLLSFHVKNRVLWIHSICLAPVNKLTKIVYA